MYEAERREGKVIIRRSGNPVYTTPLGSYVIYRSDGEIKAEQVNDLSDHELLIALATAIEIAKG